MLKDKLISYIENSVFKDLLSNSEITDISYNGKDVYYQDNTYGRLKSNLILNSDDAKSFLRQISNLAEKQFSFSEPILDVNVGKYRINAVHQSLSSNNEMESVSFSIRISSSTIKFSDEKLNLPDKILCRLNSAIARGESIAIGGRTGSGKTEMQKFLISKISNDKRVIIIDNISELDCLKTLLDIDITNWRAEERNCSLSELIKNSLRSNPDWLILAESRGGEMLDILNASMSGHPTITTLHASSLSSIHSRLTRLAMMNNGQIDYEFTYKDIVEQFSFLIFMDCSFDQSKGIQRYIQSIGVVEDGMLVEIYRKDKYVD